MGSWVLCIQELAYSLQFFGKFKTISKNKVYFFKRFLGLHRGHLDTHLAATKRPFAKKNYKKHLPSDLAWKLFPRKSPHCRGKKKKSVDCESGRGVKYSLQTRL